MKKIMNSKLFLVLLTTILVSSITVYAVNEWNAEQVSYKNDKNSNVTNVKEALDYLYKIKQGDSNAVESDLTTLLNIDDPCVISSGYFGSYTSNKAFDKNTKNGNIEAGNNDSPWAISSQRDVYVGYAFGVPVTITKAVYTPRYDEPAINQNLKQYKYQYSDDLTTWKDASNIITTSAPATGIIETKIESGKHKYWRLYVISNWEDQFTSVNELQFYGKV